MGMLIDEAFEKKIQAMVLRSSRLLDMMLVTS